MRIFTRVFRLLAPLVLASTALVTVSSATPAQAAPYWQTYSKDSHWYCSPAVTVKDDGFGTPLPGMYAQSCQVRNSSYVQAVLVVTNNTGKTVTLGVSGAGLEYSDDHTTVNNSWAECNESAFTTGNTRACFARTVEDCSTVFPYARLMVYSAAGEMFEMALTGKSLKPAC